MTQKLKKLFIPLASAASLISLQTANAQFFEACNDPDVAQAPLCVEEENPSTLLGDGSVLSAVIQFLIYAIGAIAFLMIVIGALRYVLSVGDPQKASQAKNTIIYALVGVVLALLSQTILTAVLERL